MSGNVELLFIYGALAWILAAFGEEMVYRGYLMNQVADLIKNKRMAWAVSAIVISALFGFAHMDQGVTGMIDEGLMGMCLALLYLAFGRSLAVPIIAHGVADTIDIFLIFLGKYRDVMAPGEYPSAKSKETAPGFSRDNARAP